MAQQAQGYANHGRYYPIWHFFAFPVLAANVIVTAVAAFRDPTVATGWQLMVALALVLGIFASRAMSLMTQDRIIRAEERTRLKELLPEDMRGRVDELTPDQLIGLRFASDPEVPDLTAKILDGGLTDRASIKKAVQSWRADHMRV